MNLKPIKRATITPDFKEAMLSVSKLKLSTLHEEYLKVGSHFKPNFIKKNGVLIATLKAFVSDTGKQDKVWAQLRMLNFEKFDVETWGPYAYLKGTTLPIINEGVDDIGEYSIYINMADYIKGDTTDIHFIPERDPLDGFRFWHHYAKGPRLPLMYPGTYGFQVGDEKSLTLTHRLDAQPYTCWGDFGSAATMQFGEMNTPELFRNLYIYLSRHNPNSNLRPQGSDIYPFRMSFARAL